MKYYTPRGQATEKARSFLSLPDGWCFGEGGAPSEDIVDKAVSIIERAELSLLKTDVFPGQEGEIQVSAYFQDHYLEFIIESDHSVTFTHECNNVEISYQENMQFNNALKKLSDFGEEVWPTTSERSTRSNIMLSSEGSQVWPSEILPMVGSRFLTWIAQKSQAVMYVNTSKTTTDQQLGNLQSSGSYRPRNFQQAGVSINI